MRVLCTAPENLHGNYCSNMASSRTTWVHVHHLYRHLPFRLISLLGWTDDSLLEPQSPQEIIPQALHPFDPRSTRAPACGPLTCCSFCNVKSKFPSPPFFPSSTKPPATASPSFYVVYIVLLLDVHTGTRYAQRLTAMAAPSL